MMAARAVLNALSRNLKTLIAGRLNVRDECGRTALMRAAYDGSTDVVKSLISKGADVNAKDLWDVTALIMATARGRVEIVRILKEAGASE